MSRNGYQGRRKSPVMDKVLSWGSQHPNTEFSLDAIAKSANISMKQAASAMSRAHRGGFARLGAVRGYWIFETFPQQPPSRNGGPQIKPVVTKSVASTIDEGDLLEVFRKRSDEEVVLVDQNKFLWVATKLDI